MLCQHYKISLSKRLFTALLRQSSTTIETPQTKTKTQNPRARFFTTRPPPPLPVAEEILPRTPPPSQDDVANALREHFTWRTPVIVRGAVHDTDARRKWDDLEYLNRAVGPDTPCEIEIGAGYNDPAIEKPAIAFESYVDYVRLFEETYYREDHDGDDFRVPKPDEMVYCAQNVLFEGLKKDFCVPSFCEDRSYGVGDGVLYDSHVYFGPQGSMSPLHYDPMDNIIMQFVGEKPVLLYPQTASLAEGGLLEMKRAVGDWYYAGDEGQQYNTSPIDVERPDLKKYPRFKSAPPALEGHLYPGDLLYIPKRWWHHVRNLKRSIAINTFWH